jgi:hypothetical protein
MSPSLPQRPLGHLSVPMGKSVSPWANLCPHGQICVPMGKSVSPSPPQCPHRHLSVPLGNSASPWATQCPHGQLSVPMGKSVSPWANLCPHGQICVPMGKSVSPWATQRPLGQPSVPMGNSVSPWANLCPHGQVQCPHGQLSDLTQDGAAHICFKSSHVPNQNVTHHGPSYETPPNRNQYAHSAGHSRQKLTPYFPECFRKIFLQAAVNLYTAIVRGVQLRAAVIIKVG